MFLHLFIKQSLLRLKDSISYITMDVNQKPTNTERYCQWLFNKHSVRIDDRTRSNYNHVVDRLKNEFEKSVFWLTFIERLPNYQDEYITKRGGFSLYILQDWHPVVKTKDYDSFLHKTFRKNCIHNKNFPNPPFNGWVLPGIWYSQINDLIRTSIVVRYLDGQEFILDKILELCKEKGLPEPRVDREVKSGGYYAIHVYIKQQFQIPNLTFNEKTRDVEIEIQITTEIQDIIKRLLHIYYERRRNLSIEEIEQRDKELPWHHEYDEFSVHYLGQILHYVEGMIMEIRIKEENKK